jgi:hypothetical protein
MKSAAYSNAANTAAQAQRDAQSGFTGQELSALENQRNRAMGGQLAMANSLQSGLAGMGNAVQSASDAVRQDMMASEAIKRQKMQQAYIQQNNLQGIQEDAFSLDLGDWKTEQDMIAADHEAKMQNTQNIFNGVNSGFQGLLDSGAIDMVTGLFNRSNTSAVGPDMGTGNSVNGAFSSGNTNLQNPTPGQQDWNMDGKYPG